MAKLKAVRRKLLLRLMESLDLLSHTHWDHELVRPRSRRPPRPRKRPDRVGCRGRGRERGGGRLARFMEGLNSLWRMHWDHELVRPRSRRPPRPRKRPDRVGCRGRGRERGGGRLARFMEGLNSLWRMHWDHELVCPRSRRPPRSRKRPDRVGCRGLGRERGGGRLARFMESASAVARLRGLAGIACLLLALG